MFFLPDVSIAGYLAGARTGAAVCKVAHLYGGGAAIAAAGLLLSEPGLAAAGLLWMGHVGFDRMLGYGLKLPKGFGHTHLGPSGRRQNSDS